MSAATIVPVFGKLILHPNLNYNPILVISTMESTQLPDLPGSMVYPGRTNYQYPDPPSIASFANADDASKAGNDASNFENLLMIGASAEVYPVYPKKTPDQTPISSSAHADANSTSPSICSDRLPIIPDDVLREFVNNTLEELSESDWKLIKDNDRRGLRAFQARLRDSVESWANNSPETHPPACDRTARTSNVCLISGHRPLPLEEIHYRPSWNADVPPSRPSVSLVTDTQGMPDSIAPISVILPFSVDDPYPNTRGDRSQIRLTGTREFCRQVVLGMKSLEPVLRSVVSTGIRGKSGAREDMKDIIGELLEEYFKIRIGYESEPGDYRKIDPSIAGDMMEDPDWTIGNNEDGSESSEL